MNTLDIAKQKSEIGAKLTILLKDRNLLQMRLDELNKSRYYSEAEVKLFYQTNNKRLSNDISIYKLRNILYSTNLQILGKEIVDKLNEIDTKLIFDLISMIKTHLEIRIELIDKLIENINNEKSNTHTG